MAPKASFLSGLLPSHTSAKREKRIDSQRKRRIGIFADNALTPQSREAALSLGRRVARPRAATPVRSQIAEAIGGVWNEAVGTRNREVI